MALWKAAENLSQSLKSPPPLQPTLFQTLHYWWVARQWTFKHFTDSIFWQGRCVWSLQQVGNRWAKWQRKNVAQYLKSVCDLELVKEPAVTLLDANIIIIIILFLLLIFWFKIKYNLLSLSCVHPRKKYFYWQLLIEGSLKVMSNSTYGCCRWMQSMFSEGFMEDRFYCHMMLFFCCVRFTAQCRETHIHDIYASWLR